MNIFGLEISLRRKSTVLTTNEVLRRLEMIHELASGIVVTPETCMQSPTVQAIVQAISRRIATLPVTVQRVSERDGRKITERLPSHPVAKLLSAPNDWQTRVTYWLDATSWLVRYGNFYAFKARGQTGPIRRLVPLVPGNVQVEQDPETLDVKYRVALGNGNYQEYQANQIHHCRGPARDGVKGDSPVMDVAEAIALEIAAEKMGAAVFGNGAQPGIIFKFADGSAGFKTDEERAKFVEDFQNAYTRRGRHRALLLPKGIDLAQQIAIDNEKAQFLATRQYQRTVIAGAFGVPPHMVGDLSKGTFNNVEQQSLDFTLNVVLPYVRIFEAAMERDLLTTEDRAQGIRIRFNLEGALRGDFKTRQEGLKIQREMGVINANEWRELEGLNPISEDDGGETYWVRGPSGQGGPESIGQSQQNGSGEPQNTPANEGGEDEQDA